MNIHDIFTITKIRDNYTIPTWLPVWGFIIYPLPFTTTIQGKSHQWHQKSCFSPTMIVQQTGLAQFESIRLCKLSNC